MSIYYRTNFRKSNLFQNVPVTTGLERRLPLDLPSLLNLE